MSEALTRRRLLRAGAGLALAPSLLAACGGGEGASPPDTRRIGLSVPGDDELSRCVASGALRALAGSGYTMSVARADHSVRGEIAGLSRLIEREKVAGLVIVPTQVESATRAAQFAQQRGIRVVAALSPGPGPGSKFFAGTVEVPGREGGRLIGRWLVENVPAGGEIVVVQGMLGQGVSELLDEGLDDALAGKPRFEVVLRGPGNLDPEQAVEVVRRGLELHPRTRMVVDYGGDMGDAIAAFLRKERRDDIVHVTSGEGAQTQRWLRTPYLRATRHWSAARLGRTATRMALTAVREDRAVLQPFTVAVPQSMRTAQDIARAEPFCDAALEARATALVRGAA